VLQLMIDEAANDTPKSKSQRKREVLALQALGETLVDLPANDLATIPMPAELEEAVMEARGMHQREAKRRHLQYIGKLMRELDAEPIEVALQKIRRGNQAAARRHVELEKLRDSLLNDGAVASEKLFSVCPEIDRQLVRQLVRNAAKEQQLSKPAVSARKLFRYLRDLKSLP
ncbi:MAG: ribosome biogenesis factor YjgA, partial [Pseudomonadales bacterium]